MRVTRGCDVFDTSLPDESTVVAVHPSLTGLEETLDE